MSSSAGIGMSDVSYGLFQIAQECAEILGHMSLANVCNLLTNGIAM